MIGPVDEEDFDFDDFDFDEFDVDAALAAHQQQQTKAPSPCDVPSPALVQLKEKQRKKEEKLAAEQAAQEKAREEAAQKETARRQREEAQLWKTKATERFEFLIKKGHNPFEFNGTDLKIREATMQIYGKNVHKSIEELRTLYKVDAKAKAIRK